MAKEYLKKKGFAYEEHDVFKDVARRQEMVQASGQLAVPVIRIDDKVIVGFNRAKINELLGIN
jgi:glutaredoxin